MDRAEEKAGLAPDSTPVQEEKGCCFSRNKKQETCNLWLIHIEEDPSANAT